MFPQTKKERKKTMEQKARSLLRRLSTSSTDKTIAATLADIRLFTKQEPESRSLLADAGVVSFLLRHLDSVHPEIQENASASLLNVSITAPESVMSTPSLLPALARSLQPNAPDAVAQNAAATIYSLLSIDAYRPIIGSKHVILSSLLSLLESSCTQTIKDCLRALFAVSLYAMNRETLVELGAVSALFCLVVRDRRIGIVEDATAVIAQVAGCCESVSAFREVAGVRVLVMQAAKGGSGRARENAVSALVNLATSGGDRAVEDIMEVEEAEEVAREMAERGSVRGRAKGEALLKILRGRRGCYHSWYDEMEFLDTSESSMTMTMTTTTTMTGSGDASSF